VWVPPREEATSSTNHPYDNAIPRAADFITQARWRTIHITDGCDRIREISEIKAKSIRSRFALGNSRKCDSSFIKTPFDLMGRSEVSFPCVTEGNIFHANHCRRSELQVCLSRPRWMLCISSRACLGVRACQYGNSGYYIPSPCAPGIVVQLENAINLVPLLLLRRIRWNCSLVLR